MWSCHLSNVIFILDYCNKRQWLSFSYVFISFTLLPPFQMLKIDTVRILHDGFRIDIYSNFCPKMLLFKKLPSSNRSENINLVKKTKAVQNLILNLLRSFKYFSVVQYFCHSNFNILKAFFSKGMTSLSKWTMRSVWHWFRAQFATNLMSDLIFCFLVCV